MRIRRVVLMVCAACGAGEPGGEAGGSTETTAAGTSTGAAETTTTSGAPTTSGGTGGADGTTTTSGGSSSEGGESGEAFVVDCGARFARDGRLAFACNVPRAQADCVAVAGAPCGDADADGLTDAWEDLLLAAMHPLRRFDEAEQIVDDATAVMADVGRVIGVGENTRVFVMLGYHLDYGSCGFTAHNGDSERVGLDLAADPEGGPGGVVMVGAYTAAHENTDNDHGMVFTGPMLDQLVFAVDAVTNDPRWVVFPSADKHATYATVAICEDVSPIPCLDEDCAPDDVADPAKFDVVPPVVNAGEEAAPRVTELSGVGFPGEDAWALQDFCGGLGGTGCSAPVRDKLLVDPF